jgi:serine/threonine protein kinase
MRPELFGRYTLLQRLGSGGMAEVFMARAVSVGGFEKLLAIKRLLPYCTQDQEVVALLGDEARITVRLTHPNIVQVFDFGRVNDSYFIAMEYVDGLDLRSLLRPDETVSKALPLGVTLYIISCLLDALEYAHIRTDENGQRLDIIHRDVSPHNILLSREGQVKLTDFGVARAAISLHVSRVGDIKGKFSFMPPEQLFGSEIDHRVDIFAVGAILYEMLSGQQAYRSASIGEHLNLLRFEVDPPSKYTPDLPPEIDALCLKALDKNPGRRFSSAAEFAAALRKLMMRHCSFSRSPASLLADLVEAALSEGRLANSEESGMMTLADYHLPDHSLLEADPRESDPLLGDELTVLKSRVEGLSYVEPGSNGSGVMRVEKLASLKTAALNRTAAPQDDPDKTQPPLPLPRLLSGEVTQGEALQGAEVVRRANAMPETTPVGVTPKAIHDLEQLAAANTQINPVIMQQASRSAERPTEPSIEFDRPTKEKQLDAAQHEEESDYFEDLSHLPMPPSKRSLSLRGYVAVIIILAVSFAVGILLAVLVTLL